jgi:CRISPR/Cas system-associated exonuclease Cas4 (RecB family)
VEFKHNTIELPKIESHDAPGMRLYTTPEGAVYPSVTSILSVKSSDALDAWRKSIGDDEAKRVMARATSRGTRIHSYLEAKLNNNPSWNTDLSFLDKLMVDPIVSILEKYVDNIRAQEAGLYSKFLETAGRVDLIADFDGKLSIIDFKTSSRKKHEDEIENYYMQTSAYAVMFEEMTGIPINRLVIIMAVDSDTPQIFVSNRNKWINEFINLRKVFKNKFNK